MLSADYAETFGQNGYATDFRGCGCAVCRGKSAFSETGFGIVDTIPDVPSDVTIGANGTITAFISPSDDIDLIGLDVVAGQTYLVSLRGSGDSPVNDPFLVVYNSSGNLVGFDDDGGFGINSLYTFTATATGRYYVSAESFTAPGQPAEPGQYTLDVRQQGADAQPGDLTTTSVLTTNGPTFGFIETSGDRDMYAINVTAGQFYSIEVNGGADYNTDYLAVPPGELDMQLYLYDADGNQIGYNDDIAFPTDISSGLGFLAETSGTYYLQLRPYAGQTGGYTIDVAEVDLSTLDPLDSIDWGTRLESNSVTVYFAPAGAVVDGSTSLGWTDYEIGRAMEAFEQYENILDVDISITTNASSATFQLVTLTSTQFLGSFGPPGTPGEGVGRFAVNGFGWDDTGGLEQGGYGFITLIHEFGHGFGLAHPHDNGGTSTIMPGVVGPFGSYGVYDLNQGVYTTMSYNDGWQRHPDATPAGGVPGNPANWGYQGTMMAFDTALLQQKYGANTSFAGGDDVYVLPTVNEAGTFWTAIWDTGGTDMIAHDGTQDARIDLLAATLDYSPTGGGVISFADGIFGGYTINNGVTIENARGGGGDDVILGNAIANMLYGNAGDDMLMGRAGDDVLDGADGDDTLDGGEGGDAMDGGAGDDVYLVDDVRDRVIERRNAGVDEVRTGLAAYVLGSDLENLTGTGAAQRLEGNSGDNVINGMGGGDTLAGGAGIDTLSYAGLGTGVTVNLSSGRGGGGAAGDRFTGFENIIGTDFADDLTGQQAANVIDGGAGDDRIDGVVGDDTLVGGLGLDRLIGGAGNDVLMGGDDADTLDGGVGNDVLFGGAGNDRLFGGNGEDVLNGGLGDDVLEGGLGSDTFMFDAAEPSAGGAAQLDRIEDFRRGQDRIDLSDMDANSIAGGVQAFAFVGAGAFTAAGQLRTAMVGGTLTLQADIDGDKVADLILALPGVSTITPADMVLA